MICHPGTPPPNTLKVDNPLPRPICRPKIMSSALSVPSSPTSKAARRKARESMPPSLKPAADSSSISPALPPSTLPKSEDLPPVILPAVVKLPPTRTSTPVPKEEDTEQEAEKPKLSAKEATKAKKALKKALAQGQPPPGPATKMTPPRLLIASIGNPAPYLNTLHSAGHLLLGSLASSLGAGPMQKSRAHGNGVLANAYVDTSSGDSAQVTLWQSPSLMNVSGVALSAAWTQFVREHGLEEARLVVLHDELETALGKLRIKPGSNSPKGHNGLKSIKAQMGQADYIRIGIGIGRPLSREPSDVANYVLRKWTGQERDGLLKAAPSVESEIRKMLDKGI